MDDMRETTSAQDRALLEALFKGERNPKRLSAAVNGFLNEQEVVIHSWELLDGQDMLSVAQDFKLLLWKSRQLVSLAEDAAEAGVTGANKLVLETMKFIFAQLEKREAALKDVETRINSAYAEVMIAAISEALRMTRERISASHEIEMGEVEGIFSEALPAAVDFIERAQQ